MEACRLWLNARCMGCGDAWPLSRRFAKHIRGLKNGEAAEANAENRKANTFFLIHPISTHTHTLKTQSFSYLLAAILNPANSQMGPLHAMIINCFQKLLLLVCTSRLCVYRIPILHLLLHLRNKPRHLRCEMHSLV